jgi:hypothetical protein
MAIYTVEPERRTLHGHFSCDIPPILTDDRFRRYSAVSHVGCGLEP